MNSYDTGFGVVLNVLEVPEGRECQIVNREVEE